MLVCVGKKVNSIDDRWWKVEDRTVFLFHPLSSIFKIYHLCSIFYCLSSFFQNNIVLFINMTEIVDPPNPENFTSSPSLQAYLGVGLSSGETHFLNPKNTYSPETDSHIKEAIEKTVKSCAQVEAGMVDKLDTAHRKERIENWETISVEDKITELFGTDGKSEEWRKNAAGDKLGQGKTELTDAEKTFVAQFEIWSQNFQAHFDLNNSKQQVFLNNFLHGSGGDTSLVVDKNADFQKVALETYEQFIRKLDTKQAQKSTAFLDRVKTIYGNTTIPAEDMTMIATLAEQLFGGETMGKVIAEIVDLQAKLRSGDAAAIQAIQDNLTNEIGKQPTPEVAKKIIDFRKLADIKEQKYDSTNPPKPQPTPPTPASVATVTPTPTPTPTPGPNAAPAQPVETPQEIEAKRICKILDDQEIKKTNANDINTLPSLPKNIINSLSVTNKNVYLAGENMISVNVTDGGVYIHDHKGTIEISKKDSSAHVRTPTGKIELKDGGHVFIDSSPYSDINLIANGKDNLVFYYNEDIHTKLAAVPEAQRFQVTYTSMTSALEMPTEFLQNENDTYTQSNFWTAVRKNNRIFFVCEANNSQGGKAHSVFELKTIKTAGGIVEKKLIFIDGDLTSQQAQLQTRAAGKLGIDPKVLQEMFGELAKSTEPIPSPPEPIPEAKVAKLVERMKANNAKINDAKITTEIARLNQESGLTQEIVQGVIDRFDDIKDAERVTTAPGAENLLKRQNSAIEIVEQTLGIKTADSKLLGYRLNELLQQLKVPFENDKYKIDPQKINEIKVMVQLLKLL